MTPVQMRDLRELLDTMQLTLEAARNAVLAEDTGQATLQLLVAERCVRDAIAALREAAP